jgi:hypothetical protein
LEGEPDDEKFGASVTERSEQVTAEGDWVGSGAMPGALNGAERGAVVSEVDGSAVIGVDEGEVPELGALIEVGDAGDGEFEEGLAEGIAGAVEGDGFEEAMQVGEETGGAARVEDGVDKGMERVFEWGVGIGPGGVGFGFAGGFEESVLDALDVIGLRFGGSVQWP